jgi:iron(III) transport system substrate-binding protein
MKTTLSYWLLLFIYKNYNEIKGDTMKTILTTVLALSMTVLLVACQPNAQVVNLYTSRHYDIDQQLYDLFTEETGIQVNIIQANGDVLIERILSEGANSPADIFMTVNVSLLEEAKVRGILQPFQSPTIVNNVAPAFIDPERFYTGLTMRARIIAYHKDRVQPSELSTYEALTQPQWQGRLLMRSSSNMYNQNMVAAFVALNGEAATRVMLQGWVNQFARTPQGNDRDQARAIAAANPLGDVAILNTYYLGLMLNSTDPNDVAVAQQIGVFFPNQETTGTHINVSGAGITATSKNVDAATRLLEFLTSERAQAVFAGGNFEYPVNPRVEPTPFLKELGTFTYQPVAFSQIYQSMETAYRLMLEVNWT